jgi:2'-5' RNA ligase
MNDGSHVRAFFAVPPDPGWSESARELLARVRPKLPDAAWTRAETWHVTLRFLGDVSREQLSTFAAAISRGAGASSGSNARVVGPVVFPSRGPARVLAAELGSAGAAWEVLGRLAEAGAREAGLEPERRPLRPHVTFARLRRPWPHDALARFAEEVRAWRFPLWPVRSCVLYESQLAPGGAIHRAIGDWPLGAVEAAS